jgi:NTP pyrophosphatase (non-canonical NTP hydrolase)
MYYLYHIPGKKIGVTRDLNNRVTQQQGFAVDEYEVLLTSTDIDYISDMEIELQQSYGYKKDRTLYKNLFKSNMKINPTDQTSTFSHGEFELTYKTIQWIIDNSITSMYNDQRCYIYNKAFSVEFLDEAAFEENSNVYDLIRAWAKEKGIYDKGDSRTQYVKLMEEAGELAKALLKNDRPEIIDAIGDMVVVLTNLAKLENLLIEDCVVSAYDVIKSRKGKMIGGTFVKETL